jgi:DNA-binding response OmpR family regulator
MRAGKPRQQGEKQMQKVSEPAAHSRLVGQQPVDRALTAPPLRSNNESSLVALCSQLLALTPAESRVFVRLLKHAFVSKEDLHAAMSSDGKPTTGVKIVDVVISRLRRKLAPHGVELNTVYGQGVRLADGTRDRIRKILAEYGEEIIAATTAPEGGDQSELIVD